ncbi:MAG: tetratricopeptide repeat protein [Chloroflexi bacterium]|nr:MAG: tetratricopeptide repeat protein [Chloroflexota bacterium]
MPPLYALLGLAVATGPRRPGRAKVGRRRLWPILLGLSVLLLAFLTWPLLRATYELNRGAVQEIRADLAPGLAEGAREGLRSAAADHYRAALEAWPEQTMAHRRLGLLALEAGEFEAAIAHLERAWRGDPTHPANRKGLGYAYLWAGRLDEAEPLLRTVPQVRQELETWAWWRAKQGQQRLADYARQMAERLR